MIRATLLRLMGASPREVQQRTCDHAWRESGADTLVPTRDCPRCGRRESQRPDGTWVLTDPYDCQPREEWHP